MNKIDYFENFRKNHPEATRGASYAANAYFHAQDHRSPAPVFYDMMEPEIGDIPEVLEIFRAAGVREFYIASGFSGLVDRLAVYQAEGCKIEGIQKIPHWYRHEPDRMDNAFRLTIAGV